MNEEEDFTDRPQELQGSHDGYLRRSTVLQWVGAIVGILGAYASLNGVLDRWMESIRAEIRNERVERLNKENRYDQQLLECCFGRRR